jgi:hypothetical protein
MSQTKHRAGDVEVFDCGGIRFHLKRGNLTGQHRAAWKRANQIHRAGYHAAAVLQHKAARLDVLKRSGALRASSHAQARERMNAPALASMGRMEAAQDALLDLHLLDWEFSAWPFEGEPPLCTPAQRRALPVWVKIEVADQLRRWLIQDLGAEEAARWGMWGEELEEQRAA